MKNLLNGNGLKREIGLFSATILVVANMIGTGIFTTSGFIMAELRAPRAMMACWGFGGIFALCGALCYGELGARFPKAGGEYVFLRESFGRPMGFLSGWISLIVGFSAPIAAAAMAFSEYLFTAFGISGGPVLPVAVLGVQVAVISPMSLSAAGMILVFSLVHYHSLLTGSRVQNFLTLFKVVLILLLIGAGFVLGEGTFANFAVAGKNPGSSPGFSMETFAVSLIFISFAYSGWNAAAYVGGEIINPRKNIPLALTAGTLLVMALYLLLNLLFVYALPPDGMAGVLEIGAKAAAALFGEEMSRWFAGAVSIGILSVLSAMIMTGPRVYYAMSRDGIFFDLFGRLNPKHRTPAGSIFLQAAIAMITTSSNLVWRMMVALSYLSAHCPAVADISTNGRMNKAPITRPAMAGGIQLSCSW